MGQREEGQIIPTAETSILQEFLPLAQWHRILHTPGSPLFS